MKCVSVVSFQKKTLKSFFFTRYFHVFTSIDEIRKFSNLKKCEGKSVGFVPTMGALHIGHISLMSIAKKETDVAIASIFINPSQFSPGEDLDKYPRTIEKDLAMLRAAKIDCVFLPSLSDMYPVYSDGVLKQLCHVEPLAFSTILEGVARPEFFRGVASIVCKLFNIVQPTVAYFGQKDISQCILIKCMVDDLNIPVKLRIIETVREIDGLAFSSRNSYLNETERNVAPILFKALSLGKDLCENNDAIIKSIVVKEIEKLLISEPLVSKVEYVSVASQHNMCELETVNKNIGAVISCALRIGNVRLIDNVLVGKAQEDILQ